MIYADIGPNTAKKGKIMVPLHDDRVEYAQIQHTQTETPYTESKTPQASKLCTHLSLISLHVLLIHKL